MEEKKKGISLIALIVTIIVIIILAAIVIFSGLNTPDRANLAKFVQEISDFRTAIAQDYMQKKAEYAMNKQTRSDAQIYYAIATGADYTGDINEKPIATGEVASLNLQIQPEGLAGTDYYEITDDTHVANWKRDTNYYEPTEKHYLTDVGEPFVLPGYAVEQDGKTRWYINEKKYYEGEGKVTSSEASEMSEEEKRALAIANAAANTEDYMYTDKNGDKVKIPEKYAPTEIEGENTLDEGFVITDKNGNEWVWIEVPRIESTYGSTFNLNYNFEIMSDSEKTAAYTAIATALRTYCATDKDGNQLIKDGTSSDGTFGSTSTYGYEDTWYDESGKIESESSNTSDTTGCGLTSSQYKELYHAMLTSIYTNGGFWIGRYEAGTTTARGAKRDSIEGLIPSSKQDAYPLNWVTCSQAQTLASRMKSGNMNCSLMFGIQWDLVLKHLNNKGVATDLLTGDSSTWGNYNNQPFNINRGKYSTASPWNVYTDYTTGTENKVTVEGRVSRKIGTTSTNKILLTTGASDTNMQKNIYDLAGNLYEWTLEKTSSTGRRPM